MSLRHQYRLKTRSANHLSAASDYLVEIRAPTAKDMAGGFDGFSLEIGFLHGCPILKDHYGQSYIQAGMTIANAEILAMRILEACASARLAAAEIDYKGLK